MEKRCPPKKFKIFKEKIAIWALKFLVIMHLEPKDHHLHIDIMIKKTPKSQPTLYDPDLDNTVFTQLISVQFILYAITCTLTYKQLAKQRCKNAYNRDNLYIFYYIIHINDHKSVLCLRVKMSYTALPKD